MHTPGGRQGRTMMALRDARRPWPQQRELKRLEAAMRAADSYAEWLAVAGAHDEASGGTAWRRNPASRLYDHENIEARLRQLRRLRRAGDNARLLANLNEGIHGNMGGMGRPPLYRRAYTGSKLLIDDYIEEICRALLHLASPAAAEIPLGQRLHFFQRASHCYGRSALMLSGGGTLGYFHFGVIRALIEQGLCPEVVSGASAGAFVAAVLGTRTDKEFLALFEDRWLARELTANRGDVRLGFLRRDRPDPEIVRREMERFIPDMTFLEAYEKTGRAINITISPLEPRQTSRLLNHIASPSVTVLSAVMASSALPGVFPPVQLEARGEQGGREPYLPDRRWIDGSLSQDLPAKRLARLYGVNHFIVSQVMPGLGKERHGEPGLQKTLSDASIAATKQMVRGFFDIVQRRTRVPAPVGSAINVLNGLIDQQFTGDINIFPGYGFAGLGKVLKLLEEDEMVALIEAGERATWPKLPQIETTTRIGRTLDRILHDFEAREARWLSGSELRSAGAAGASAG